MAKHEILGIKKPPQLKIEEVIEYFFIKNYQPGFCCSVFEGYKLI